MIVATYANHLDPRTMARIQRRSDLSAGAYESLCAEFWHALHTDPETIVQTPGFWPGIRDRPRGIVQYTAAMVIADDLAGDGEPLHTLLRMLIDASDGQDVQLRATEWLAERVNAHAAYHCDDLATEIEDGESRL